MSARARKHRKEPLEERPGEMATEDLGPLKDEWPETSTSVRVKDAAEKPPTPWIGSAISAATSPAVTVASTSASR